MLMWRLRTDNGRTECEDRARILKQNSQFLTNVDLVLLGCVVTNKLFSRQVAQTLWDRDAAKPRSSNAIPVGSKTTLFTGIDYMNLYLLKICLKLREGEKVHSFACCRHNFLLWQFLDPQRSLVWVSKLSGTFQSHALFSLTEIFDLCIL